MTRRILSIVKQTISGESAVEGDRDRTPGSFEDRLLAHHTVAYRVALGVLRDREAAADAVQEALFQAWRRRDQLRDPDALRAWFLSIVLNQCRMTRRAGWWSVARLPWIERHSASPEDGVVLAADVRGALARLPREQRVVIMLRYYLDLPFDEVAAIASISVIAARARASRAIRSMERHLAMPEVSR